MWPLTAALLILLIQLPWWLYALPKLFVYVGDNPVKDFVAPNAMGWTTIQIVRDGGIHDATKLIDGGTPQHKITSLAALPDILGV